MRKYEFFLIGVFGSFFAEKKNAPGRDVKSAKLLGFPSYVPTGGFLFALPKKKQKR